MTTPSNSPERPAEDPPAPDDAPGPAETGGMPPQAPPAQPLAHTSVLPPGVPTGDPFAPVARAPRVPWVNPARRGHVAAAVIVGALLFGGGGLWVGHAASGHGGHSRHGGVMRMEHDAGFGEHGFGRGHHPREHVGPPPNGPAGPPLPPSPSGTRTR